MTAQVPAKRLGTPEEVASFVVWLVCPENTFISGQNIAIDGGFTRTMIYKLIHIKANMTLHFRVMSGNKSNPQLQMMFILL